MNKLTVKTKFTYNFTQQINHPHRVGVLRHVLYVPLVVLLTNMAGVYPSQILIYGFRNLNSVRSLSDFYDFEQNNRASNDVQGKTSIQ